MRIKLSNSKTFFDEILNKNDVSLKSLSTKFKFNYSNLKQYRRGEKTLSIEIFERLISLSPKKDFWMRDKKELPDNWGAVKGGLEALQSDPKHKRLVHARELRNMPEVKIVLNQLFCEFYGILLGDGCISRFVDFQGSDRLVIQICRERSTKATIWRLAWNGGSSARTRCGPRTRRWPAWP